MKRVTEDTTEDSAVETVLKKIQTLISVQGLEIGDPLPTELQLAKTFGTSRNTIREAISTLKAYGIIESRRRVGAVLVDKRHSAVSKLFSFGPQLTPDAFNDIQGFRRLIELGVVDQVLEHHTDQDLEQLILNNQMMKDSDNDRDAAHHDFMFHLCLIGIAGNVTTMDVYSFLEPIMRRLLESGKAGNDNRIEIAAEHGNIIDAIRNRNRIAYLYHVDQHLRSGLKFIS